MKYAIVLLAFNFAVVASAAGRKVVVDLSQYHLIKQTYRSTNTPYDVEGNVAKSPASRPVFSKCVTTDNFGHVQKFAGLFFVRYQITPVVSNGTRRTVVTVMDPADFKLLYSNENQKNGPLNPVLNADAFNFEGKTDVQCHDDTTVRERWALAESGLSADRTSYFLANNCRTGVYNRIDLRQAGDQLVYKISNNRQPKPMYGYCAK